MQLRTYLGRHVLFSGLGSNLLSEQTTSPIWSCCRPLLGISTEQYYDSQFLYIRLLSSALLLRAVRLLSMLEHHVTINPRQLPPDNFPRTTSAQ